MGFPCAAASITIRVVNSRTGKPLTGQGVSVSFVYDEGEKLPAGYEVTSKLETDAHGEAELMLPDPPPKHIGITLKLTSGRWHCGCIELTETQRILQNGVIVGAASNSIRIRNGLVNAVPGQVLFAARPLSLFEELLYPLVKG